MMTTPNRQTDLRIVSLIPSATEIVAYLGYEAFLVGRSHECDFPTSVRQLPICTEPKFDPHGSSSEIHQRVSDLLASALSVYRVDTDKLAQLQPTHIITQAQCEVCAVSLSDVEKAVDTLLSQQKLPNGETPQPIQVISLQPNRLADVWDDIARVDQALSHYQSHRQTTAETEANNSHSSKAQSVVQSLKQRLNAIAPSPTPQSLPKVACIEWSEPLMAAGNWVPELVKLAGGIDCFGIAGTHSDWMSWQALKKADPDIIIVMPCGYDLHTTRQATEEMAAHADWAELNAVKTGNIYLTDGNQYFNRPGPRLVDSGEILAEIIQNKPVSSARSSTGWERF